MKKIDWKFPISLLVAFAGVLVPVLLWKYDLSSKELTLNINSKIEINSNGISDFDGVELVLDGKPLKSPFFSVLELSNSGSKPISASDFEGALKISVKDPVAIVKYRQTMATPENLHPVLRDANGVLLLEPLLLNPGDVIRITLITANGEPAFSSNARISGVSEVVVINSNENKKSKRYWGGLVVATLIYSIYVYGIYECIFYYRRNRIFQYWLFLRSLVLAAGSSLIVAMLIPENNYDRVLIFISIMLISILMTLPSVWRFEKRNELRSIQ